MESSLSELLSVEQFIERLESVGKAFKLSRNTNPDERMTAGKWSEAFEDWLETQDPATFGL